MQNKLTKDESVKISKEHKKIVDKLVIEHKRSIKSIIEIAIDEYLKPKKTSFDAINDFQYFLAVFIVDNSIEDISKNSMPFLKALLMPQYKLCLQHNNILTFIEFVYSFLFDFPNYKNFVFSYMVKNNKCIYLKMVNNQEVFIQFEVEKLNAFINSLPNRTA